MKKEIIKIELNYICSRIRRQIKKGDYLNCLAFMESTGTAERERKFLDKIDYFKKSLAEKYFQDFRDFVFKINDTYYNWQTGNKYLNDIVGKIKQGFSNKEVYKYIISENWV